MDPLPPFALACTLTGLDPSSLGHNLPSLHHKVAIRPTSIGITLNLLAYHSGQQIMIGHTIQLPSFIVHTIAITRTIIVDMLVAPPVSSD